MLAAALPTYPVGDGLGVVEEDRTPAAVLKVIVLRAFRTSIARQVTLRISQGYWLAARL